MNVLSALAALGTAVCALYSPNAAAAARALDANGNTARTEHIQRCPTKINCRCVRNLPPRCRKHVLPGLAKSRGR
jgi:hypothetical protein